MTQRRVEPAILTGKLTLTKQAGVEEIRFPFFTTGYAIDPRVAKGEGKYWVEVANQGNKSADLGLRLTERWDLIVDVRDKPNDKEFELTLEAVYWNGWQGLLSEWAGARIDAPTRTASLRVLFPIDKPFTKYQLSTYKVGARKDTRIAENEAQVDAARQSIYLPILSPTHGNVYEAQWTW